MWGLPCYERMVIEVKTFFNTQAELADELKKIINLYKEGNYEEDAFIESIKEIVEKNKELIYKGEGYAIGIERKLGKKRLSLIERVIKEEEDNNGE